MKLGFIKPDFPNEKRVAILPEDILNNELDNQIFIEEGFGEYMDVDDGDYRSAGCEVFSKDEIFERSEAIFSLKLMQPGDYGKLRNNQLIVGWVHPDGSGKEFTEKVARPKSLVIADLDNIHPKVYYNDSSVAIDWLKRDFIYKNSYNAGYSAVMHALLCFGLIPSPSTQVAVLSSGNVAQGAFSAAVKLGARPRMFYRKTMKEFYSSISRYDIIINGIEADQPGSYIISRDQLEKCRKGCLFIDAAADAGNAIEGTRYTSIDDPIYKEDGLYFYEVNNVPSIFYKNSSVDISRSFCKNVYSRDVKCFYDLARTIGYR
ncbi:N(5)-(carboxyethyl)ornithine synthase [Anaerovorax odorimutans]|uniref:N(5)-(Carboxyethyl)ornithine synthase n=1 Tax=Anaerovorax odorimutans TaxID=109327 RepID=A0ABT1RRN1_9FIRM|nr:N(5)-(carboxyethyl)ornithine synthase [Anaerovorax odorimutans]MCQ4637541.1 N(5)-(carboxyethyl)ornithine synthase [Anaerovorax odorimutans]